MLIFLKLFRESYRFAIQSIVINKVRTLLSLLGITIGIFSVISVLTIFDSMEIAVRSSINSLGSNVLFIQKWPWRMDGNIAWWKIMKRPEPSLRDMKQIQKRSTASEKSAFLFGINRTVKYKSNSIEDVGVLAVSHYYDYVMPFDLKDGRYFTPLESQAGRNVAIIGSDISENLYEGLNPIGRTIKIFGSKLKVIGLMKKQGDDMFGNTNDDRVIIPVNYARSFVNMQKIGGSIIVMAKPMVSNDELKDELTGILRSVRKLKPNAEDDFAINETSIISQGFDEIFAVFAMVGWIVGGFSLLVGGFGIANIMFVSVKERTNQIGIQMALGAKRFFILFQFLFESVFLSLLGGLIGLLIIYSLILISNTYDIIPFPLKLTTGNIIISISVSAVIGLVAGIIPSWSASRLDPVEAMRTTF
jgi:putative ABC transport system permease protein